MSVSRAVAGLVLIALAACAAQPTRRAPTARRDPFEGFSKVSDKRFGPPVATSQALPWQVGQWAAYRRTHGSRTSLEVLRLVAIDGCGSWFDYSMDDGGGAWVLRFCLSAVPTPDDTRLFELLWAVIESRLGRIRAVHDFRRTSSDRTQHAWLVALVQPSWLQATDAPREDVATLAGHFEGVIKHASPDGPVATSRWSHPAVMFGGVVKEVSADGYERVLIAQGSYPRPTPVVDAAFRQLQLQR